ncbi:N-acetylmuramoyl-L-alanine amidase [Pedobacter sp. HMF7647]|uniref:N-acetylmuramoyl-L-alanine amidase n=1 Tax=Hufsiella arboris TaxID=2695275 RepID=A0A7K1YEH9_9SPHI|nr:N-acetylmuramoyl-L-alanine amidase [Hufsiella arboris]MXV52995.1 N-acetylmuramoyl-L-alanine amidase [Hufsiella arboris]
MTKKLSKFPCLVLIFLTTLCAQKPAFSQVASGKVKTIVIDAGHGGQDRGASGEYSAEKSITLKVALALGKAIEARFSDVRVIYTRTTDVYVKLYDRIGIANRAKADVFISIHCNSLPLKKAGRSTFSGTETYVSGSGRLDEQDVAIRENASILFEKDYKKNYDGYDPKDPASLIIFSLMKNQFRKQSLALASKIQEQFGKSDRNNLGVREQSLAVLARAGMPAVLTEIGYISSTKEEKYMNSNEGRAEIVENLLTAIAEYKLLKALKK